MGGEVNKEASTWIRRPVEDVFDFVTSLEDWPKWRSEVVSGALITEGPIGVGSQARGVVSVMGRSMTIDIEITSLEPGASFGYRTTTGPAQGANHSFRFSSQDGGTLVTLTDEVRMEGFMRLLRPLMIPQLVRSNQKNLAALKAVLET